MAVWFVEPEAVPTPRAGWRGKKREGGFPNSREGRRGEGEESNGKGTHKGDEPGLLPHRVSQQTRHVYHQSNQLLMQHPVDLGLLILIMTKTAAIFSSLSQFAVIFLTSLIPSLLVLMASGSLYKMHFVAVVDQDEGLSSGAVVFRGYENGGDWRRNRSRSDLQ